MEFARKSLGQHWLVDEAALKYIATAGDIEPEDTVLEIGPGQGALTKLLVKKAKKVVAVELDEKLAFALSNFVRGRTSHREGELEVVQGDILKFDLGKLPRNYKVVANIPYYLTGKLLRLFATNKNRPSVLVLLVQKEVAERITAIPGAMSLLSVSVQLYFEASSGKVVPAGSFKPSPKVDSQVVILKRRTWPLFKGMDEKKFFEVVKAGFSSPRKKLRSSLAAGLHISKEKADDLLADADINGDLRPGNLSLKQWHDIYTQYIVKNDLRSLLR